MKVTFKFISLFFTGLLSFTGLGAQTETEPSEQINTAGKRATDVETKDPQSTERKKRDEAYQKGARLYREKKFVQAAQSLQVAAASKADDGEAGILLGYCYFENHQYGKALQQYKQVSETAKLISIRNRAQKLAATLDSYMRGICPGNCLKPSMPGWRKMSVPGTPDRLVWMVYPYLDPAGKGGSEYWSNDHMGEVIEYVNGRPINKGRCPICGGTGKVSLPSK